MYFSYNATATTEIYTLSLHDALPISRLPQFVCGGDLHPQRGRFEAIERHDDTQGHHIRERDGDRWTRPAPPQALCARSEEHTSELQSPYDLVCRLLLEKKKNYLSKTL